MRFLIIQPKGELKINEEMRTFLSEISELVSSIVDNGISIQCKIKNSDSLEEISSKSFEFSEDLEIEFRNRALFVLPKSIY